jgi:hypothetical protein
MLSTKAPCKFEVEVMAPQECGFATFSLVSTVSRRPAMDSNLQLVIRAHSICSRRWRALSSAVVR